MTLCKFRMFSLKSLRFIQSNSSITVIKRCLNSGQTAAALRPFYFAVHPDLFGKHPKERFVNEQSLKTLHEYVAALQTDKSYTLQPIELVFYIRPSNKQNNGLKDVKITLQSSDLRKTVSTILQACGLSLDYVNTVPVQSKSKGFARPIDWHLSYHGVAERKNKPPPQKTLGQWLQKNSDRVQEYNEGRRLAQIEIDKLCNSIVSKVGVASLRWENVWGNRHYIACLHTFDKLCNNQLDRMRKTLAGRVLVFGNETGINLHGEIVLGSEDVTTEWMNLLQTVGSYDPMIERLPKMEQELSHLLNNIQIIRRHKQEFVMAQAYEVLLNKMLNFLRRSQDLVASQLCAEDLSHLLLVVESESGPLALTNSGQLLIPASVPGSLMVQFIVENKDRAAAFLIDTKMHMFYLEQILDQCHNRLNVSVIIRDETITPQQMTQCCQRLLDNSYHINPLLHGTKLKVSTYYTLMRDGEVTIPWDWVDDKT